MQYNVIKLLSKKLYFTIKRYNGRYLVKSTHCRIYNIERFYFIFEKIFIIIIQFNLRHNEYLSKN